MAFSGNWQSWVLAILIGGGLSAIHVGVVGRGAQARAYGDFLEVHSLIGARYVGEISREALARRAIDGMVGALDPYSRYFDADEAKDYLDDTRGSFGGLGMFVALEGDQVSVIAPLAGNPAARAGLLPGDIVLRIDGEDYSFTTIGEALKVLKGEPGSKIRLELQTPGVEGSREVTIERAIIAVESVRGTRMLESKARIGTFKLLAFQQDTRKEALRAISDLVKVGARAVIIDLRSNPGGLLDSAARLADALLPPGVDIVSTKGRDEEPRVIRSEQPMLYPGLKIAVLIDEGSASASEILAGALRDNGAALLVGARSFGKGSVQTLIQMRGGETLLKLTTSYYYTPSGRRIHRAEGASPDDPWGLLPDIEIEQSPEEKRRLLEQQSRDYLAELKVAQPEGAPATPERVVDRALMKAVEHLEAVVEGRAALIPERAKPEQTGAGGDDAGSRD